MPTVREINVAEARELLKSCPKSVQDYVAALERAYQQQQQLTEKAIAKLRERSK